MMNVSRSENHMRITARALALAIVLAPLAAGGVRAQGPAVTREATVQVALTEQQIAGFIAVTPEIAKVTEALQSDPDPKTLVQLNAIAKKGGFADYAQYELVTANIALVLQGVDPETKKFTDPKQSIQTQIREIEADTEMTADEKKDLLAELNEALAVVQPISNPGNIALVEKHYDKLAQLIQE
jgi:hypothetical protein